MNEEQAKLIQKARQSLGAAKVLGESDYPEFAISRAYYAMFYVASAFLEGQELSFSRHSAVIAAFGKNFAKTNIVPRKFHRYLIDAEKARCEADYDTDKDFSSEEIADHIRHAEEFLSLASLL